MDYSLLLIVEINPQWKAEKEARLARRQLSTRSKKDSIASGRSRRYSDDQTSIASSNSPVDFKKQRSATDNTG